MTPQEISVLIQSTAAAVTYADTVEVTIRTWRTRIDKNGNVVQHKETLDVTLQSLTARGYLRSMLRNGVVPTEYKREVV